MSRRLNRILTVLVLAVFVTVGWSLVGRSAWAARRNYLGAGLEFDSWIDPLVALGGMVLIAVTATRLIERSWKALFPESVRRVRNTSRAVASSSAMADAA